MPLFCFSEPDAAATKTKNQFTNKMGPSFIHQNGVTKACSKRMQEAELWNLYPHPLVINQLHLWIEALEDSLTKSGGSAELLTHESASWARARCRERAVPAPPSAQRCGCPAWRTGHWLRSGICTSALHTHHIQKMVMNDIINLRKFIPFQIYTCTHSISFTTKKALVTEGKVINK